jgi:hypothetical protein
MSRPEIPIYGAFYVSLPRAIEMLMPLVENEEELKEFLESQKVWPTAVIERGDKCSPATWPKNEEVEWYVEKEEMENLARIFSKN